jgi:adenine phosphoribosyltransferase
VNGIDPGDRVTVIDDTISTGGTLVALLRAVQTIGAEVHDVVALVEKIDNGGVARVFEKCGIRVKTLLKIQIVDGRVIVL